MDDLNDLSLQLTNTLGQEVYTASYPNFVGQFLSADKCRQSGLRHVCAEDPAWKQTYVKKIVVKDKLPAPLRIKKLYISRINLSACCNHGKQVRSYEIENETSQTRRFWIELPSLSSFDFKPGQFITLDLPIHEKPNKRVRSYSIASWPDGTNVIELVIVLLEDGAGTHYLFNEVSVGAS